ncbi:Phytochrome two-component sensor histidine kinase Cyanobacterial phytochrome B [Paramagnetospirillum magnetotacticum MS-1]|uniref:histidine kinase n=1 Tax=Paramagnetospirillum magnetotacticum MS-1 TaxID=272627 RepID=A0A0C2U7N5_PARME|nr:sensor histidine kinase [Paramagnetospirillum magnetotacticum]KIL97482.1 Phytochrome two-component sensor histidine kinase Cyanobacterial phytochrome B [Paramagnetospirillum magnetotacticum MS-1]
MISQFRLSFRAWLMLISAASAIPIIIFSAFTLHLLEVKQRDAVYDFLGVQARITATQVDQRIETALATLHALALSDAALSGNIQALHAQSRRLAGNFTDANAIVFICKDGENIFNTNVDFGKELPRIGAIDSFKSSVRTGSPSVSDMFLGSVTKAPVIAINYPTKIPEYGDCILRLTIRPSAFNSIMSAQNAPKGWTFSLIDSTGTIIGRNREPEKFIGTKITQSVLDALADGIDGPFDAYTMSGDPVKAKLQKISKFNLYVAVGAPLDDLISGTRRSLIIYSVGGIAAAWAGLLIAFWVARHLNNQLRLASGASIALGLGAQPSINNSSVSELNAIGNSLTAASAHQQKVTAALAESESKEAELAAANAALASQTEELVRSNAELEQFAYVASHDLREPLRMISSYLSLLERRYGDRLDGDGLEFIGFARDGAKRMDHLVLDLLDLSRIERKGDPIVPMPIMPSVQLALTNLGMTIKDNSAIITTDDAIQHSWVLGDPTQIMRLFQNLIGNSLKYRKPDADPVIQIGGRHLDGYWQFSVGDNGIGIASEYFERVFGIFQRLHTREKYEGTGIGLAVCKKIVERHRGRIWVESIPSEGSTFHFTVLSAARPGGMTATGTDPA